MVGTDARALHRYRQLCARWGPELSAGGVELVAIGSGLGPTTPLGRAMPLARLITARIVRLDPAARTLTYQVESSVFPTPASAVNVQLAWFRSRLLAVVVIVVSAAIGAVPLGRSVAVPFVLVIVKELPSATTWTGWA